MILSLKTVAEDFERLFHASIVDKRTYQDVFYLGNIYRIRIKHMRRDKDITRRSSFANRKPKAPRINYEVLKCDTCGGPAVISPVGSVCMYKGCEVVTTNPPRLTI